MENKVETPKIYEAIIGVMSDVGAVGKDSFNPQQKYKYRGIDAVMNALQPALVKNKVFVQPIVLENQREERKSSNGNTLIYSIIKTAFRFFTTDGSYVEAIVTTEGMDSGDKSLNKALSAGFKYACFQTFCIPTDEMVDSETESPEVKPLMVDEIKVKAFLDCCNRKGIDEVAMLKKINKAKPEEMTVEEFMRLMQMMSKAPDKEQSDLPL